MLEGGSQGVKLGYSIEISTVDSFLHYLTHSNIIQKATARPCRPCTIYNYHVWNVVACGGSGHCKNKKDERSNTNCKF